MDVDELRNGVSGPGPIISPDNDGRGKVSNSAIHPYIFTRKLKLFESTPKDTIRIRNLLLLARIADGAQWPSATLAPVRQPVRVSVSIPYDLRPAAAGDDISKSINYGSLSKQILASVEDPSSEFGSLEHFLDHIFLTCFGAFPGIQEMTIDVVKSRALPYAEGVRILSSRARNGSRLAPDHLLIQQLSCNLIVGLNPCEREDKQVVCFDVDISAPRELDSGFDLRRLAKEIHQVRSFDWGPASGAHYMVRRLRHLSSYLWSRWHA